MAVPVAKHAFTVGEISPEMLGRQDTERYASACSTARNFFAHYTGPLYSRAGTAFVGFSKQTGRAYPPRLIEFQFATDQGLALEFGNLYMRVISNGAFVTEAPIAIAAVTNSNPCSVTLADALGVGSATPITAGVIASYAPGDTVTLAGGSYEQQAVLSVTHTEVVSLYATTAGTHYVPGDTVTFAGGTFTSAATASVLYTQVVSATVAAGGSGGTSGTVTLTGTTGTGTKFTATGTINGTGALTSISGIATGGQYSVNPTTLSAEPVTGGGLTGATLSIVMGVQEFTLTADGSYTANPTANILTQGSTSGSGIGAQATGIFAPTAVSVSTAGNYASLPSSPASQASTSGGGVGATFTLTSTPVAPAVSAGDWIYISGVEGAVQLNAETFVVASIVAGVATLHDAYGNNVDSTSFGAYLGGGSAARIYTLATPYAEADLPYLKFVQSADTLSIGCVNSNTLTEYQPQDLTRTTDTNWSFSAVVPAPSVTPPASASGVASAGGAVNYEYVVTAVDSLDGTESIASPIATISNAVDIQATSGSITVSWSAVAGVSEYYIYKALPSHSVPVAAGSQFGYAGFSYGNSFVDSNVTPDFTQSPPTHRNPFARGVVTGGTAVTGGSGYTSITLTPSSATGSGAVLTGVLQNGALISVIVDEEGSGYKPGDAITISGNGSGAAATLQVGPESGTYPSTPAYFQERRGYANSLNNPDTYWFSQPGAFTNFDIRNPTIASDAITGSPWAVQVNGVQWLIQTSGGLLVMTGLRAWLLVGAGSFATNVQPITPSNQNNVPQAFTGCSSIIAPILINYDVLYVDSNGVYYYDLPYQLYALSEPIDLTDVSSHLFDGYTVVANAYCEKPYRLVWSVRSDGALLSLTYYKTQKVQGWTRHDTQGLFVGCCSVAEPPVDALYLATQRFIGGNTAYMIERMDNRVWTDVESTWCVDCGLAYPQPTPAATLTISSAAGLGSITGVTGLVGGSGYSAGTSASVVDQFGGTGSGAVPTLTIVGGVITAITFAGGSQGSGYTQPMLVIVDPAGSAGGSGASADLTLSNATTLTASYPVFPVLAVGSIVRAAGGIMEITAYVSATQVTANVLSPCTGVIPNSSGALPPIAAGNWTMTAPISTVTGLRHLAGATVTGIADGNVIPPTVVSAGGTITLPTAASAIKIGLGFQAQFQDVPIDVGNPTVQGQRKKIAAVSVRTTKSRGFKVGTNQPDGSAQSPPVIAAVWSGMQSIPESGQGAPNFPPKPYNALATPLRTGDVRVITPGGIATPGQICVQQDEPLPCNVVALVGEFLPGDTAQTQAPQGKGK